MESNKLGYSARGTTDFSLLPYVLLYTNEILPLQVLHLDWRPLARDVIVYCISIALFIGFSWDGVFHWYEALIMLILYIAYILIMKVNPHLMKFLAMVECWWCR